VTEQRRRIKALKKIKKHEKKAAKKKVVEKKEGDGEEEEKHLQCEEKCDCKEMQVTPAPEPVLAPAEEH
jgi:hypothetical protein